MNKRYENKMLSFCATVCLLLTKAGIDEETAIDAAAIVTDSTSPEALYVSLPYKDRVVGDVVMVLKAGKLTVADRASVLQRIAKGAAQFVQHLV